MYRIYNRGSCHGITRHSQISYVKRLQCSETLCRKRTIENFS